MTDPARPGQKRRILSAGVAVSVGLVVVALGLELAIRFLVLSDSAIARNLGAKLRFAHYFAAPRTDEDYWKLQFLLMDSSERRPANFPDSELGWTSRTFEPGTYGPLPTFELQGRTPVLLYGDSFAACNTPESECFQGLIERSALGDRYGLVNYGVGGYGVDQIYMLVRASIDRWKELDPIVVVSFLVDDDFDRSLLGFRCWPKPRASVQDGRLVCTPPPTCDPSEYVAAHPIEFPSYLLRLLAFGPITVPRRLRTFLQPEIRPLEERQGVARATLEAIRAELDSRGVRWFLLAFHGEQSLRGDARARWADDLARAFATEHGIPLISSEPFFLAAAGGDRRQVARFFGGTPRLKGHYNRLGNIVAFQALAAGIEGRFDHPDTARLPELVARAETRDLEAFADAELLGCRAKIRTRGASGTARVGKFAYAPFDRSSTGSYLILRPGEQGPTEVRFFPGEPGLRFRGRATAVVKDSPSPPSALALTVRANGCLVMHARVPVMPDGIDLDVDLDHAALLELVVERSGDDPASAWIHVERARFESTRR